MMENWRIDHLKKLLSEDADDEFIIYALAQEYLKSYEYPVAIDYFLELKKINAGYVGLYYHLADAYVKIDDEASAMKTYDEGIEIARKLNDQHALSELQNARMNLEMEL